MDRIAKNSTYELRDSNPVKEGLLQLSQMQGELYTTSCYGDESSMYRDAFCHILG